MPFLLYLLTHHVLRVAHDKLFGTVKQLEALNTKPPGELLRALMLLHSYTLVKSLIAINDHTTAARMLVRVVSAHVRRLDGTGVLGAATTLPNLLSGLVVPHAVWPAP